MNISNMWSKVPPDVCFYWKHQPVSTLKLTWQVFHKHLFICPHKHHPIKCTVTLPSGEGNGTPLQYSCLENPMDAGAWWAAVHGVAESQTRLSNFTFTFHFHALEKEMATHSSVLAWRIPGTGGAWWAAVSGVAQSWTRLKWLSNSSNIAFLIFHMRMWTVKGVQKDDQCPVQTYTEVLLASLPALTTGPLVRTTLPHAHVTHPWQSVLQFTRSFITAPCCPALFLLHCCRLFHRLR